MRKRNNVVCSVEEFREIHRREGVFIKAKIVLKFMMQIISLFKMLTIKRTPAPSFTQINQISTSKFPLQFMASPIVWAEPLKAKKKIDPAIIKAREEKKKRKVEKMIRRRLRMEKQLKPIYENQVPNCLIDNLNDRERKVSIPEEVSESRIKLFKQWAIVRYQERQSDFLLLKRLMQTQQRALNELRLESEELYQAAVKVDEKLIPLDYTGPTETPKLENYVTPDGEYEDISKKW